MKPFAPKGWRGWIPSAVGLTTEEVIACYESGMAGAFPDPYAREELRASVPYPDGEQAAYDFGLVGDGAGKLSLPYLYSWLNWPKCWPCPGQTTGDCVSHAGKNSGLVLIGSEVASGLPDPDTGIVEGFPVVTAEAEEQGVVACENIYRARGHSGQGASCERLISYVTKTGGIMLRKNYPELNLDLTRYDARLGIPGGSGVPEPWNVEGAKHRIRTATEISGHENGRDFLHSGFVLWACSGLGWSSNRDENGYSRQQGSWSHSWIIMAYDDRADTIKKYGFPLALYNHDWGKWNSGSRQIRDSAGLVPAENKQDWINKGVVDATTGNILIPEGSMWIDARLLNRCDVWAMSSLNGFPRRRLKFSWI